MPKQAKPTKRTPRRVKPVKAPPTTVSSVRVMLSYDYCHFEIQKGTDQVVNDAEIDAMRKDATRLAFKAIEQYKIYKRAEDTRIRHKEEYARMLHEAQQIEQLAEEDRTPRQQATLKSYKDRNWEAYIRYRYDFEDDFQPDDDEGE